MFRTMSIALFLAFAVTLTGSVPNRIAPYSRYKKPKVITELEWALLKVEVVYGDTIRIKYGEDTYKYIQERMLYGKDEPPMMGLLRTARRTLEPYWAVQDNILQAYGIPPATYDKYKSAEGIEKRRIIMQNPQLRRAEVEIGRTKSEMLNSNPTMERYYRLFYAWA